MVLSNSSTPFTQDLYRSAGAHVYEVTAGRAINSRGDGRGPVKELIPTSFEVPALWKLAPR